MTSKHIVNCTLPYRCVKCINAHAPGSCPLDDSNNKTKPCCVNCKGKHTANNARLCPTFKRNLELKESKAKSQTQTQTQTKAKTISSVPKQNTQHRSNEHTYANAIQKKNQQQMKPQRQSSNPNQSNYQINIKQIMEENQKSMYEMMQSIFESQNKLINTILNKNVSYS